MKRYKPLHKEWISIKLKDYLEESLRFSDLQQHAGLSPLTMKYRKERNKLKGAEANVAKLHSLSVNKKMGWVTFTFLTAPTYSDEVKITNPKKQFKLSTSNYSAYTMQLRIMDFFKWAKTKPNFKSAGELSLNELKEILMVADIQVFCNCPSYHWQGMNFNTSMFSASVFPTNIPPKQWNKKHNEDQILCKHLSGLISGIKYWLNPMTSTLNKYLKGM